MDESLPKRVGAAAVAGWWTVLIAVAWLLVGWMVWMAILRARPDWLLILWGLEESGDWKLVRTLTLWFFGVFKVVVLVAVMIVVWLSIWAGKLKRAARQS